MELWRGTEGSEEESPDQPDAQENHNTDGDPMERKLNCVVSTRSFINCLDHHDVQDKRVKSRKTSDEVYISSH